MKLRYWTGLSSSCATLSIWFTTSAKLGFESGAALTARIRRLQRYSAAVYSTAAGSRFGFSSNATMSARMSYTAPVKTWARSCTSVPTWASVSSLSALGSPVGRPRAQLSSSTISGRNVLLCKLAFVWATIAATCSGCDSVRKIAVRSAKASCSAPVWGGLRVRIQFGLNPSSTAWPVSCATMSCERQV